MDRERQGADLGESHVGLKCEISPNSFADDVRQPTAQFLRLSTTATTTAALHVVHELPPDQLVLAACALDNGNVIVTITRDSIQLYDPLQPQTSLQSLPLPNALQNPVAHQPHVSWTDSHLIVHAPVSANGGVRARTAPTVYAFDAASKQLFPLDLDAFDMMTPVEDAAARKAGKRSALFCDSLSAIPLARPASTTATMALPTEMDKDEDALYGAAEPEPVSKQAAATAADGIVQPEELGAERWEWIAEIDSKGDLKVRPRSFKPATAFANNDLARPHADPPAPIRSRSL